MRKQSYIRSRLHKYVSIKNDIKYVSIKNDIKYVSIKNDIIFNANATTHRFRIVFISFSAVCTKTMKMIENGKNLQKSIVCVSR